MVRAAHPGLAPLIGVQPRIVPPQRPDGRLPASLRRADRRQCHITSTHPVSLPRGSSCDAVRSGDQLARWWTRLREAEGPEAEGPEAEGPEAEGPEAEGPEAEGPEAEGPEDAAAELSGRATIQKSRRATTGEAARRRINGTHEPEAVVYPTAGMRPVKSCCFCPLVRRCGCRFPALSKEPWVPTGYVPAQRVPGRSCDAWSCKRATRLGLPRRGPDRGDTVRRTVREAAPQPDVPWRSGGPADHARSGRDAARKGAVRGQTGHRRARTG